MSRKNKDNVTHSQKKFLNFEEIKSMHPMQTMLYITMIGSAFLFFSLILLYTYQLFSKNIVIGSYSLPKTFILSTFVLLASSFFLFKAKISLKYDKLNNVSLFTLLSFILGSTFIGLQLIGWVALSKQGFNFSGSNVVISYVYFISGVHLIHLVVGLFYLGSMSFKSYKASKDPVDELLFSTNPSIKFLYKQVSLYWHYLDMVWLVLFLFFLFTL